MRAFERGEHEDDLAAIRPGRHGERCLCATGGCQEAGNLRTGWVTWGPGRRSEASAVIWNARSALAAVCHWGRDSRYDRFERCVAQLMTEEGANAPSLHNSDPVKRKVPCAIWTAGPGGAGLIRLPLRSLLVATKNIKHWCHETPACLACRRDGTSCTACPRIALFRLFLMPPARTRKTWAASWLPLDAVSDGPQRDATRAKHHPGSKSIPRHPVRVNNHKGAIL